MISVASRYIIQQEHNPCTKFVLNMQILATQILASSIEHHNCAKQQNQCIWCKVLHTNCHFLFHHSTWQSSVRQNKQRQSQWNRLPEGQTNKQIDTWQRHVTHACMHTCQTPAAYETNVSIRHIITSLVNTNNFQSHVLAYGIDTQLYISLVKHPMPKRLDWTMITYNNPLFA